MVNVLRRWSQPIMVIITVLVIVSFTYFGQNFYGPRRNNEAVLSLYGREINMEALQRQGRRVGVFAELGGDYITAIHPAAMMGARVDTAVVARSFVFEHEADQLGLSATDDEKIEALQKIPIFRGQDGKFDPNAFLTFKERVLNPQGFTDNDFDQIFLAGEVRARKLKDIVGSTIAVSDAEVRAQIIAQRQTTEASYIVFRRDDFQKDVKVTEEELKKRFEEQKEFLKTPEQRKVRYAAFTLQTPPDGKPLETKVRNAELEKLATAAYAFREELEQTKANFTELAKNHKGTIAETGFFTMDNPPNELEGSPEAANAAFTLSKEKPYSEHLMLQKGTYVLEFVEAKAPEDRKFEDVKGELEKQIAATKGEEIARTKANEARTKLAELVKGGKTFADAAKELGLKVEQHPVIGRMQRTQPGEFTDAVTSAVQKLAPGEFSEVVNASGNTAALIVHVDYRSPLDDKDLGPAMAGAKRMLEVGFPPWQPGIRSVAFQNWLVERGAAAGLNKFLEEEPKS